MLRIFLVHPGCTSFDQQGRIKGSLDLPLCEEGLAEIQTLLGPFTKALGNEAKATFVSGPCGAAVQTAEALAAVRGAKVRTIAGLKNVDHGLWHGKLISEVKQSLPRIYRECREDAEEFCAPAGEPMAAARQRIQREMERLVRGNREGTLVVVLPDPIHSLAAGWLTGGTLEDLWSAETDHARWTEYGYDPSRAPQGWAIVDQAHDQARDQAPGTSRETSSERQPPAVMWRGRVVES